MSYVFYINKSISYSELAAFLEKLLQLTVGIFDEIQDKSDGDVLLWFHEYPDDFHIGFDLMFSNHALKLTYLEIAQQIAVHFQMSVVTDLPENHPAYSDPFVWTIARPDGKLYEIVENIETPDSDGLIIDLATQKLL